MRFAGYRSLDDTNWTEGWMVDVGMKELVATERSLSLTGRLFP